jgi:hypothetical protein
MVVYCCTGIGGDLVAFIGGADNGAGGPAGQAMSVGSYRIAKGENRDAQDGYWTVVDICCVGGYMYCGGA